MANPSVDRTSNFGYWTTGTTFTIGFASPTPVGEAIWVDILFGNYQVATISVSSVTDDATPPNTYVVQQQGVNSDFLGGALVCTTNANPQPCQNITVHFSTTPQGASGYARTLLNAKNTALVNKKNFSTSEST